LYAWINGVFISSYGFLCSFKVYLVDIVLNCKDIIRGIECCENGFHKYYKCSKICSKGLNIMGNKGFTLKGLMVVIAVLSITMIGLFISLIFFGINIMRNAL